jgi:hypothetical protein
MPNRARAVRVSRGEFRAERVMLVGLASSAFLQYTVVNRETL